MIGMFLATYAHERKTEECTVRKVYLETEDRCKHCNNTIQKGNVKYVLCSEDERIYVLDETCFQTACTQVCEAWSEANETMFQSIMSNAQKAEIEEILAEVESDPDLQNIQLSPEESEQILMNIQKIIRKIEAK